MNKPKRNIHVVKAQQLHIIDLANRIKQDDVDEGMASHGMTVEQGLKFSLRFSSDAYTVVVDGVPEMIFGVCPSHGSSATIWMMSSEEVFTLVSRKRFLRETKKYVTLFHKKYAELYNHVSEKNLRSLDWLRKVGFKFTNRVPNYGVAGLPFIRVESRV